MLQVMPTFCVPKQGGGSGKGGEGGGGGGEEEVRGGWLGGAADVEESKVWEKKLKTLKLGEGALVFLQWFVLPHLRKVFNRPEHAAFLSGIHKNKNNFLGKNHFLCK
jgi:hypothetical protein